MAYVDLNPIRAGLSETLEESEFTSIQERIRWYLESRDKGPETGASALSDSTPAVSSASPKGQEGSRFEVSAVSLLAFTGTGEKVDGGLPFHFSDYLELVDWTGRAVRSDKRGFIPGDVPPILSRLGEEPGSWIETVQQFRHHFFDFVGPAELLVQCGRSMDRKWLRGVRACRRLFGGGVVETPVEA